ncbi:uncharacterized protein ACA1_131190 [Acanthamoeba castellanii str. Neff]|uniref:Uncharacterized protein n=1 Tax=Acanthamoeba castellanii (strain ATCC 30010 / Neff) TaxID=1257118 RepID=L8GN27_ACACF|nr:uncharacterized protein ACA1_131190 [Acanthamoeba castellanii str. Neff]ELR14138.1 hypothetical protein ACA1_131190 [Acanthamoeba castellanii str. Neff]
MPLRVGEDSGAKDASVAPNTHLFRVAIVDRITAALEPALGVAGLLDAWRLWLVCDVASPATEQFHQTRTTALQGPIDAFLKTESWSHYLAITRAHNCRDTLAEMGNRFAASAVMIGHRVIGQARLPSPLPQNALLVFGCNDFNYLTPFLDAATDRNLRGWYRSAGQAEALQAVNSYMDKTVELNVLAGQRGAAGLAVDLGDSFFAPLLEGADNTAAVPTACVE